MKTTKNIHIVAYKTPLISNVQLGAFMNEQALTSLNVGQGVEICATLVLSGQKVLEGLSPTQDVKTPPEAPQKATEARLEVEKYVKNKKKSLEEMVAGTRYLVGEYGTENEKRYIGKFLEKVKG